LPPTASPTSQQGEAQMKPRHSNPPVLVHNPARLARQRDTGLEDKRLLR